MAQQMIKGSCLCGQASFQIDMSFQAFKYCHCSRCRKATGSAHASNIFVLPEHFRWISGEKNITRYDLPEAMSFATCFCKICGSPMPHETRSGKQIVVPAGSIDDDPGQHPENNIFWKFRASWYLEPDEITKHDAY